MSNTPNSILSVKATEGEGWSEPVSVADFKSYAAIAYSDYDTLIQSLIISARIQCEAFAGLSFGVKSVEIQFKHRGCPSGLAYGAIHLPQGYVDEVTALTYRSCYLHEFSDILANTDEWEIINDNFASDEGEYQITFTTKGDWVTEAVKTAIKAQTDYLFRNRDSGGAADLCATAKTLLSPLVHGSRLA